MSRNKSLQAVLLTKSQLLEMAAIWDKNLNEWSMQQIVTAWRALESTKSGKLTTGGWLKKFKDMKYVFEMENIFTMTKFEKELRLITNTFIKNRIDSEPLPAVKRSANIPPFWVWKKMIQFTSTLEGSSVKKRLRRAQSNILMCWTLSTGARLEELLRLRQSDIKLVENDLKYLKITIRRGKSNRSGKKPVFYYAHENNVEPVLCPIRALKRYMSHKLGAHNKICSAAGDHMFPAMLDIDVDGCILAPKNGRKAVSGKAITSSWRKSCLEQKIKKEHIIEAHSGRNTVLNAAWAHGQSNEQILDITNWSSTRMLPEYVSGPNVSAINVKLTKMSVEEIDSSCKHLAH